MDDLEKARGSEGGLEADVVPAILFDLWRPEPLVGLALLQIVVALLRKCPRKQGCARHKLHSWQGHLRAEIEGIGGHLVVKRSEGLLTFSGLQEEGVRYCMELVRYGGATCPKHGGGGGVVEVDVRLERRPHHLIDI